MLSCRPVLPASGGPLAGGFRQFGGTVDFISRILGCMDPSEAAPLADAEGVEDAEIEDPEIEDAEIVDSSDAAADPGPDRPGAGTGEALSVGLVFSGGGAAAEAWHAGVVRALQAVTGWDARRADLILGTSAGAITGLCLRAGIPPADLYAHRRGEPVSEEGSSHHRPGDHPLPRGPQRTGLERAGTAVADSRREGAVAPVADPTPACGRGPAAEGHPDHRGPAAANDRAAPRAVARPALLGDRGAVV